MLALLGFQRSFAIFDNKTGKQLLNRWRPKVSKGELQETEHVNAFIQMVIAYNEKDALCFCTLAPGEDMTFFAAVPVCNRRLVTYKVLSSVSTRTLDNRALGAREFESFLELQEWCKDNGIKLIF